MPPATPRSYSPQRMSFAAYITPLIPEPQTLLIVTAPASTGIPAPMPACPGGALAVAPCSPLPMRARCTCSCRALPDRALQHVAHEDLLTLLRPDAGVLECALDRHRAELRRGERGEGAEERADRRARAAEDHDFFHGR